MRVLLLEVAEDEESDKKKNTGYDAQGEVTIANPERR